MNHWRPSLAFATKAMTAATAANSFPTSGSECGPFGTNVPRLLSVAFSSCLLAVSDAVLFRETG